LKYKFVQVFLVRVWLKVKPLLHLHQSFELWQRKKICENLRKSALSAWNQHEINV